MHASAFCGVIPPNASTGIAASRTDSCNPSRPVDVVNEALESGANTGPNTTQCESNGNAQIVTSPPANNNYGYWGFPIIGFGGWGLGW